MTRRFPNVRSIAVLLVLFSPGILALTAEEKVARLSTDLTPVGAERTGNGSDIPEWKVGLAKDDSEPAGTFHKDPFASDIPFLRISAANIVEHKNRLSAGQIAMLQRFPDMYFDVYPTHRSASYPDYVYDAIKVNAERAQLMKYGAGVTGATMSSPFPIPENGLEALWNHTLRFRGQTLNYTAVASAVASNGLRSDTLRLYEYYVRYSEKGLEPEELDNKIFFLKRKTLAPAKLSGGITLVHETLDQVRSPRKSWIYVPGQRRLRRTPDLAYDTSDSNTNSIRTIDQVDMFNGAPDYYDWSLLGKQEMYIPYNSYKVHQNTLKIDDILHTNHLNSALLRYEAHRVWVVEANLRVGFSHRYAKRRYYLDEDSWSIIYAEEYDATGTLLQVTESHTINYYDQQLIFPTLEVTYDFTSGQYYVEGLDNERPKTLDFSFKLTEEDFSTNAVRREAKR